MTIMIVARSICGGRTRGPAHGHLVAAPPLDPSPATAAATVRAPALLDAAVRDHPMPSDPAPTHPPLADARGVLLLPTAGPEVQLVMATETLVVVSRQILVN